MIEFEEWPKTPRLFRDVVVTEKIDGTNAAVVIESWKATDDVSTFERDIVKLIVTDDTPDAEQGYVVAAQSRKRLITPEADNYGFARWVRDNAADLVRTLGEGRHYGEWWGSGIQRGYGLTNGEKRFSLFNTARWTTEEGLQALEQVDGLYVVPVLYEGIFSQDAIDQALWELREFGSPATGLEFDRPEGVCVFHSQSRQVYKVLLENDHVSKTVAAA